MGLDDDKETEHHAKDEHQDADFLETGTANEQHRATDSNQQQRVGQTAPDHQTAIDADRHSSGDKALIADVLILLGFGEDIGQQRDYREFGHLGWL